MILATVAAAALSVVKEREAIVTAYTPSLAGGGAGTGLTSTGVPTDDRPYGIAVDPRQIPYGAVVYVPGYRDSAAKGGPWWPADDTGAAMRASTRQGVLHLDCRMRHVSAARAWGVRRLMVKIFIPDKDSADASIPARDPFPLGLDPRIAAAAASLRP